MKNTLWGDIVECPSCEDLVDRNCDGEYECHYCNMVFRQMYEVQPLEDEKDAIRRHNERIKRHTSNGRAVKLTYKNGTEILFDDKPKEKLKTIDW